MESGETISVGREGHEDSSHSSRPSSRAGAPPTIEDFQILKPISRGAFGKVFLCHRKDQPERKLAVKVMKKAVMVQKNMTDQVVAERNAAALAKSPFCVSLLYCLQTTNNVFLIMEYMIGGDLKSLLGVYGFFQEQQAIFYLAECVLALEYLHKRGIVHRDIKPDNMLLSATGHLKLTDFGLSTTGLRDRELQVADLVGRTPWHQGAPRSHLVRTPGQILSLTSHLSFSSLQEDGSRAESSQGGSFIGSSSPSTPPTRPATATPASAPAPHSRVRLTRKNSFTEALARHTAEQEERAAQGAAPLSSPPRDPALLELSANSSFRLQELPNSSMDLGHLQIMNRTIDFDSCLTSPKKGAKGALARIQEDQENIEEEEGEEEEDESVFGPEPLTFPSTTPPRPVAEDDDSRGSLSSSPKPLTSLISLQSSFHEQRISLSPVLHDTSSLSPVLHDPTSISPVLLTSPPLPATSSSSHPTPTAPLVSTSLASANMRALRVASHSTPEQLRAVVEPENSDIVLEESIGGEQERQESQREGEQEREAESHTTSLALSSPPCSSHFKVPTPLQTNKRKVSCSSSSSSCSSFTGLTEDLTDLAMAKRCRVEGQAIPTSPDSTKSSSTSSEEEQGPGYGYSTPNQPSPLPPLSAVPRHLKGFKAVKFVSPAGVTPVQHPPSSPQAKLPSLPMSLATLDMEPSSPSTTPLSSPLPTALSTPYRTPKSLGKGRRPPPPQQSSGRLLGTPDYLAPELLLRQGHSRAVDWWALGVCLYEFMVGIPPFCASSPEEVFHNILSLALEWPEGEEALSPAAVQVILALLSTSPDTRADGAAVRSLPLCSEVDWAGIGGLEAPFVPRPDDASDTTYFNARNSMQGLTVSAVDL